MTLVATNYFPELFWLALWHQQAHTYCHTRRELGFWIQAVLWRARVGSKISFDQPTTHPPGSWIFFWTLNPWCFVFVSPHLLCLSPPFMSVPTYYVCPHLLCLFPPIICGALSVYVWGLSFILNLKSRVCHSQPSLLILILESNISH